MFKEEYQKRNIQESSLSPMTKALMGSVPVTTDSQVFGKIAPDTVVIEINMSRGGIILFCITRRGVVSTHRSGTSVIDIRRHILRYVRCLRNKEVNYEALDHLNRLSSQLSEEFLRPFDHIIQDYDHVVFVPSQEAIIFSLSALIYNGAPLFLSKAVSQVPSLSILAKLHRKPPSPENVSLSAIFNSHLLRPPTKASAAAPPLTPRQNAPPLPPRPRTQPKETPIVTTAITATLSSALFSTWPHSAPSLTPSEFALQYTTSDIVLVSTHGSRSPYSPWQSRISLKTDFRVMEVSQLTSRASLVIFGACLSGLGRVTNGNDVLGFSHAILQSGASNYLGALWSVSDYVTMLLIVSFFRKLALREKGVSLAKCWQCAQQTVYGLGDDMGKAAAMLEGIKEEWGAIEAVRAKEVEVEETTAGRMERENLLKVGKRTIDRVIVDLTDPYLPKQDFRHPFFWAPFVMVGDAGLCLFGE